MKTRCAESRLQSLSLDRIERLLAALLEQSEFELVRFQNQPSKGGKGVPDAVITASFRLLMEMKIKCGTVKAPQLKQHLERLDTATEARCVLLVLTPDDHQPKAFSEFEDDRLVWASFAALDQAIDELLANPQEVVSEREAFLLRELQAMLTREHLVVNVSDVVVVPARYAWPEYQSHHAYIVFSALLRLDFLQFPRPPIGVRRAGWGFWTGGRLRRQTNRPATWESFPHRTLAASVSLPRRLVQK